MIKKQIFNLFILFLLIFSSLPISAQKSQANYEAKINALISKMTLAEKLGQFQQLDGEAQRQISSRTSGNGAKRLAWFDAECARGEDDE